MLSFSYSHPDVSESEVVVVSIVVVVVGIGVVVSNRSHIGAVPVHFGFSGSRVSPLVMAS